MWYTLGGTTGAWELISAGNKLSEKTANSGSSVDLKANGDTKWTISVTEGNATIKGTTNTIQYNEANPRFKTYTSGQKTIQLYAISVPKYAVNFTQPEGGELIVKNGETAITSGDTFAEGTNLTVTATPANGYEGGTVVVKNADNDITNTVYNAGTLTMPAYAVTISATFVEKPCERLVTPAVSAETTYNSATLTWEAVANAAKYSVKVGAADAIETTATSYEVTDLNTETEYTYQVQAIAEAEQDTYCDSEVAEGTFTTAAAPTATLYLKDIEGTTTLTGSLNGTITLPTEAAECSKTFVGWDADENCDHAPTYAPGAEFELTATESTLYAVYASGTTGETVTIKHNVPTTGTSTNMTGNNDANKFFGLDADAWSVVAAKGGNSNNVGINKDGTIRLYYAAAGGNTLTVTAPSKVATIKLTYNGTYTNAWVKVNGNKVTPTDGVYTINAETFVIGNANTENVQVHIKNIAVTLAGALDDYSTTCVAPLSAPTFSVAEGTYTEAKSIELDATEGDIYYTLDGTEPTESSTPYTAAINLDECGTTTIKAIAISSDSKSTIASATYTINLPITNTAETAYTPIEAIAIIDGACDKTEEVFVKGVVVSTSAFNATYGNYDVIVKAVDDNSATPTTFTFYRMYKAAGKTKFTASDEVIGVGDIITAKGVLKKHNSTYELAEGCYMVERVAYTEPKTDISNTLETAYTVDKAFELISDIKSDLDKEVYVKGLVAVASTELYEEKYLTYSISDKGQNSGNVLKVYDGLDINGVAFTSKDDVKVGDYVVIKGKLLNYKGTYELNKGNQLVQHVKAATIKIADITMEVGETKTIAATITPDAAKTEVTYSIKAGSDDCITLSENNITAKAEGTATIVATIATAAEYMGKTVEFKVTVTPKSTKQNVVILAEYDGKWYAMTNECTDSKQMGAIEVDYQNGVLFNVDEARKATITWELAIADGKATFKNNNKYLIGGNLTTLNYANSKFEWVVDGDKYLSDNKSRTFLYNKNGIFKNYATSNAEPTQTDYSGYPVVAAPNYGMTTADIVENSYFSVGNNKYVQFSTGNLQYEVGTNTWSFASEQYEVIGGAAYDGTNNTNFGMNVPGYTGKLDLFAWSADGKFGVNPSNKDADYQEAFVDWGELVNEAGWYTLTQAEMRHILNRTKDGKKLWTTAELADKVVLILLPDNWDTAIDLAYGYVPATGNYDKNVLTIELWKALEEKGAVLLPSGGSRTGGYGNKIGFDGETVENDAERLDANGHYFNVNNVGDYGYYWLNTPTSSGDCVNCASYLLTPGFLENDPTKNEDDQYTSPQVPSREKRRGNSVRLVKEVTPNYTREGQGAGVYGTVCYPENIVWCDGATLYEVAGKEGNKVIFDEVTTPEAGMPYIFIAEQEVINFFCGKDEALSAGDHNSLQGTFVQIEDGEAGAAGNTLEGNYILYNNIIKKCGAYCGLYANRAYFIGSELESLGTAPSPVQGRRRISLEVTNENTTTGLDNITNGENTTIKVIENGQLIIIRNGEKYNAQGVRF